MNKLQTTISQGRRRQQKEEAKPDLTDDSICWGENILKVVSDYTFDKIKECSEGDICEQYFNTRGQRKVVWRKKQPIGTPKAMTNEEYIEEAKLIEEKEFYDKYIELFEKKPEKSKPL